MRVDRFVAVHTIVRGMRSIWLIWRLRIVDYGLWIWIVDYGLWIVDYELWIMASITACLNANIYITCAAGQLCLVKNLPLFLRYNMVKRLFTASHYQSD